MFEKHFASKSQLLTLEIDYAISPWSISKTNLTWLFGTLESDMVVWNLTWLFGTLENGIFRVGFRLTRVI